MRLGEAGMLFVRYVGPWTGKIKGPCTGYQYAVAATDRARFYVDIRDVPGLMGLKDNDGNALFAQG